ncbi:unnamed protein product [Bubo scandiacus]
MQFFLVGMMSCDWCMSQLEELTPLLQSLDNLKKKKYNLHVQPAGTPVAERLFLNYWRTQECASKPSEIPPTVPHSQVRLHKRAPLGLVDTPLLDKEHEVNYWFLPLDLVAYPVLVHDDNLLWLLENAALIECKCREFCFIVNFLCSEKMLPDDFSGVDALEEEVLILGIPVFMDAVKIIESRPPLLAGGCSAGAGGRRVTAAGGSPPQSPLHAMALGLLANSPESALGQLCVGSTWAGAACTSPATASSSSTPGIGWELADFLSLKIFLKSKSSVLISTKETPHYPELLSNDKKVCWIACGQTLLIYGDGQMFRHVLNFLRLGKFILPNEFKEWPPFCQEAEEYQIPSLSEALYHSDAYSVLFSAIMFQNNEVYKGVSLPCRRLSIVTWNEEHEFSKDPKEVYPCAAVDSTKCCIKTWSNIKNLKGKQETSGVKYSEMSLQAEGIKRRNTLGGYNTCSASLENSSFYKHLGSPSRKRGMRSSLTEQVESKDSASHIQKLISLVKESQNHLEWDTVSSKRCDFQHVRTSDSGMTETVSQCNTPEKDRGVKAPVASAPGKISFTIQGNDHVTQCEVGAEGKQLEKYVFTQSLPVTPRAGTHQGSTIKTTPTVGNDAEDVNREQPEGSFSSGGRDKTLQMKLIKDKTRDSKQTVVVLAGHRNVGLILKAEHPLVVQATKRVLFAALGWMAAGWMLQPIKRCPKKDPKEIPAKVGTLVNRLWTQHLTPREFVADLLNMECFKGGINVPRELLQWVEVKRVGGCCRDLRVVAGLCFLGRCLDLLVCRGFAGSVSYFALET